jgi:chromate reductase
MKVLAFAASSSSQSINKKLVSFVASYFLNDEVDILDLNDYEMPIFSVDKEHLHGIPSLAFDFSAKIASADLILISFAEHNGAYSAAFKNIFDWVSRIPKVPVFQDKPLFLMATSPGPRGGASVLELAKNRFPFNGGQVIDTFSLPSFGETFQEGKGIINPTFLQELENKITQIQQNAAN